MRRARQDELGLTVRAADQATELHILDANLSTVLEGAGQLEARLPRGMYKVIGRSGDATHEELVLLEDRAETVSIPALSYTSSAPLEGTRGFNPAQADFSREGSIKQGEVFGLGSGLYFHVRDIQSADQAGRAFPRTHPMLGLSLHTSQGELLLSMEGEPPRLDEAGQPQAVRTVELDPGTYRLRLTLLSGESHEQILVANRGWSTQVFLSRKFYGDEPESCRVDLAGASIFLNHLGLPFDPESWDTRLTDMARRGLADKRYVPPVPELRNMLAGKFDNPMLGILGGHILLLGIPFDPRAPEDEPLSRRLLDVVNRRLAGLFGQGFDFGMLITNLRHLFNDERHPDVEALALLLDEGEPPHTFRDPPMLRQSWSLVVEATARYPALVPADSLASRVATRVLNQDPWLIWRNPEASDAGLVARSLEPYQQALAEFRYAKGAGPGLQGFELDLPIGGVFPGEALQGGEGVPRAFFPNLTPVMRDMTRGPATSIESLSEKERGELVRRLGIPASTIQSLDVP